jgi:S-methylmethionine-dependent homocysteine/selenocysteine methylase
MLDLSRVGGPASVFAPAHSHIITDTQSGWHETINVRVLSLAAWNDIAAARSLTRLRELQALGQASADIPTNVYFFFEVQAPNSQP